MARKVGRLGFGSFARNSEPCLEAHLQKKLPPPRHIGLPTKQRPAAKEWRLTVWLEFSLVYPGKRGTFLNAAQPLLAEFRTTNLMRKRAKVSRLDHRPAAQFAD